MSPSNRAVTILAPWRRTLTVVLAIGALAVTGASAGASPAAAASPADVADDIPNFLTPVLVTRTLSDPDRKPIVAVAGRGQYGSVVVSRLTGLDSYAPFVSLGRLLLPGASSFAATILGDPAAVQTTAGIEVFVRGADNRLYTNTLTPNDQAVGYSAVPGGLLATSDPEAVQLQNEPVGNIRLFVRGTDGAVWSNIRRAGNWEGWTSLGGFITSEISVNIPLVAAFFPGQSLIQLVARGADKRVYLATIRGANVTWEPVGGNFQATSNITFSAGDPLSVLYARGEDGRAWTIDRRVAGAQWTPIDGQLLTRGSDVAASGLSIFVTGGFGRIFTNRLGGSGYTELTGDAPGGRLVVSGNPVAFRFKNPNETVGQTLLFKETDQLLAKATQPGPGLPFNRFDYVLGGPLLDY